MHYKCHYRYKILSFDNGIQVVLIIVEGNIAYLIHRINNLFLCRCKCSSSLGLFYFIFFFFKHFSFHIQCFCDSQGSLHLKQKLSSALQELPASVSVWTQTASLGLPVPLCFLFTKQDPWQAFPTSRALMFSSECWTMRSWRREHAAQAVSAEGST